jgi:hypothetical protein
MRGARARASRFGRVAGCAAATAILLTACVAPQSAAEIVPMTDFDCAVGATPGGVPEGFAPVAAYSCDAGGFEDVTGWWSATIVRRLEGDLRPLLDAFAAPDDPPWIGPCPTVDMQLIEVWLVDAEDRGIRLRYPIDGCGLPKTHDALWAVDALDVVSETRVDVRLEESRAAMVALLVG